MTYKAYLTTDMKRPFMFRTEPGGNGQPTEIPTAVTGYSRSEPLTRPTLWGEATWPSILWATGASIAAFSGMKVVTIVPAVLAQLPPMETYNLEIWAAILAGSVAYMHHFRWRLEEYDQIKMRHEEFQAEPMQEKQVQEKVRATVLSPNGRQMRIGNFSLTQDEWRALAHTIFKFDNRIVRDVLARATVNKKRIFPNITGEGVWQRIYTEFERLGWARNNVLTDQGEEYFSQFTTPPL